MVGSTAGASPVTLLRSAPRQAYRIYSEEEFLAAGDWQVEAAPRREPKRWGRLAALAALASVVAAVVGVIVLNATRSKSESDRRFAGSIAARGGSRPEIVADRSSIWPLDARPRKRTRRASLPVPRATKRRSPPVGRPPIPAHPYLPPQPPPHVETASASTTADATATPTRATASTPVASATAATAPPGGADSQFGFERR
jgi:hypothetical protein